jgi:sporulation protein YlmC with PRC-barrel domain
MAHHADQHDRTAHPAGQSKLVRLSDSKFRLADRAADVRGLGVFNQNGEQMGSIEDLYIDPEGRRVRFLDVAAGGIMGLGEKRFLIPVEAVARIYEDGITVKEGSEKVSESPLFDTKVVAQAGSERDVYDHYGYPAPLGPPFVMPVHPGTTPESPRQTPDRRRSG